MTGIVECPSLTTWLLVDLDANMDFGTTRDRKSEIAAAAVATIGFLNARDSNRLGALLMAGPHRRQFPPRPGRDHVRAILTATLMPPDVTGQGHTDLTAGLHRILSTQHHRGMIVVVSDLRGDDALGSRLPDDIARATLEHDVLVVQVVDRRDVDIPDVGLINLVDPASGREREVVVTPALRTAYRQRAKQFQDEVSDRIRAAGADHMVLETGGDWLSAIARHVRQRRNQRLPRRT